MGIEKLASDDPTPQNVKDLVKRADAEERVLVVNMRPFLKKAALVVVATGPRAEQLRQILEACD